MHGVFLAREQVREQRFESIWTDELDAVFADVAPYYDKANMVASLGLLNGLRRRFVSTMHVGPGTRVLDVCAGTNAVGIELLRREPSLRMTAIDRSKRMQEVGRIRAGDLGLDIESVIGDAHELPFRDDEFDVVTLQFASRHLRLVRVLEEIRRVLKPGGQFYHCDLLRPANRVVEEFYYVYLWGCLNVTAWLFECGEAARGCRRYFIHALRTFYSTRELSELLADIGYCDIEHQPIIAGTLAFHKARKV